MDLVYDLVNGHRRSKVLFAVVELGIVDILAPSALIPDDAHGCLTASEVATYMEAGGCPLLRSDDKVGSSAGGVDREALGRLMDAATNLGLLESVKPGGEASEQPRFYRLSPVSAEYLASSSPRSVAGYVMHSNRTVYPLFQHLERSVLSGTSAWDDAFGMPSSEMWACLYSTPEAVLRFMRGMHGFAALSAREVLTAFELSDFKHVVDLGGATGAYMYELTRMYPSCSVTVVDLPHVVETAQSHFTVPPYMGDAAAASRVQWLALDFFEAIDNDASAAALPHADLYVLTRILHDWDEPRALKLLTWLRGRMAPGGALLIGEMLLAGGADGPYGGGDGDAPGPTNALLQDLNMLVQAQGRERSPDGYRALLSAAGFDPSRVHAKRTGSYLDAVIAFV